MWPDGNQPKTQKPDIIFNDNIITIQPKTNGSSSAYIISDKDFTPDLDDRWQLYHKPIIVNKGYIYVISIRLGFQDSDIVKIKL